MLRAVVTRVPVKRPSKGVQRSVQRQALRTVFTQTVKTKQRTRHTTARAPSWQPHFIFYSTQTTPPPNETTAQKWLRIGKEMAQFYMNGIKQLWYNRKRASGLAEKEKVFRQPLTWEEHKFLATYRADRLALVPFFIIWVLPGSGVTLPLIAAVFPGLLPSTLRTPSQNENARSKRLKVRKSLSADLLAVFSSELASNAHMFGSTDASVHELTAILHKASLGQTVTADELIPLTEVFSKYLDVDEIPSGNANATSASGENLSSQYSTQWNTLMPAKEVIQIASFVGSLSFSFLPTPVIRNSLKKRLALIQTEDKLLGLKNTLSTLTRDQLVDECDLRSLQTGSELSDDQLRWQLAQWVKLSTSSAAVSPSLLIFFALSNINANLDVINPN